MSHELQGTGYDSGARGYELQGRASSPPAPTIELPDLLPDQVAYLHELADGRRAEWKARDNAACVPASCINGKCQATGECACPPWPKTDREWANGYVVQWDGKSPPLVPVSPLKIIADEMAAGTARFVSPPLVPNVAFRGETILPRTNDARRLELAPKMRPPPLRTAPVNDDEVNPKTLLGARRVDLSLLPPAGVIHGAHAMMDGAEKYGPYNWREKKVPARTYIAAAQRHLADFLDGEALATDSGVHHLGHVIGCCAIILDAMETGNLIDDRPQPGAAAAILARLETAILERRAARLAVDPTS